MKRKVRRFVIAMSGWYVALIAACVVLVVLDLLWPLFFVAVVGSLEEKWPPGGAEGRGTHRVRNSAFPDARLPSP